MKKYFLLLLFLITLQFLIPGLLLTQNNRTEPIRITTGYIDKNPQFGSKTHLLYFYPGFQNEFCIFERYISNYSQICLLNFNSNSLVDSVFYLTTNNFMKRNPTISYGLNNSPLKYGLAIWESNENGKWDLFSRYYYRGAWQNIKPFDTSDFNKSGANIFYYDSLNYAIAYERNGDIIFKWYNALTGNVLFDSNLTLNDTTFCSNPYLGVLATSPYSSCNILISYEKKKPNNDKAIYFVKSSNLTNWTSPDTVAFVGNNTICSLKGQWGRFLINFETNRGGKNKLLSTSVSTTTIYNSQFVPVDEQKSNYNYANLEVIPSTILTRGIIASAYAYVRKGNDGTKIFMNYNDLHWNFHDSAYIGDTSKTTRITLNNGIYENAGTILTWLVFNKDSAGFSNLYAYKKSTYITDIKPIGNTIPDKYSLEQNYPNPFNPVTRIVFSIPKSENVNLKIFDILGREKENLINGKLNPGTYEIIFDGSKYSSGIYFYSLQAGNYNESRKMIILK